MNTTNFIPAVSLFTFLSLGTGCTISTVPSADAPDASAADPATSTTVPAPVSVSAGCGFGEPNNTRDVATQVTLGTAYTAICLSGREDKDWFQFTAPADLAGGYVKVVLSNVRSTSVAVAAYAQATNREVTTAYSATEGESLTTYFTVAPGAKYNVEVAEFNSSAGAGIYDVKFEYTRFEDAFESNDTRDEAKSITAGTAVQAHLVALAAPEVPNDADINDWYKVVLPAGKANVKIENIPTNVSVDYEMRNEGGTLIDSAYRTTAGESLLRSDVEILAAGTYYVRVGAFNHVESGGKGEVMPDNFTRRYTLNVSAM